MRPKIAATLEGVNTNQLYKGPQAKLKKRPPKVRMIYSVVGATGNSIGSNLYVDQTLKKFFPFWKPKY